MPELEEGGKGEVKERDVKREGIENEGGERVREEKGEIVERASTRRKRSRLEMTFITP